MAEETKEITRDEERLIDAQRASKVRTTIETPGWKEVIRPALDSRRNYYLSSLLSRQDRMEDVIFAQQSVCAIDELLNLIEQVLVIGKAAEDHFKTKLESSNG
jgi:hypothetical protein